MSTALPPYETASADLPGGQVVVVADPLTGAVVASGYKPLEATFAFLTPAEQARGHRPAPRGGGATAAAVDALRRYADGDVHALDSVDVSQPGGPFLQRAWTELRGVRAGETDSYTGLAARAGSPTAVRAAGQACARNKVAPFVPCHRILRTDGSLGGYAYGLPVKQALLEHEGALTAPEQQQLAL
ncbi:MAG: methylated-DNA--[protein]-cysteine S-methyltransferase [Actinobacteria bacterium]|jgi:methylated-DNA-[protein]-cysteine S-methyltransferase|nr:methylated-DNA--[protein]-cysteine S-methyltransferase [Actinomycetota bacterium]